jgi:hypothetical protein
MKSSALSIAAALLVGCGVTEAIGTTDEEPGDVAVNEQPLTSFPACGTPLASFDGTTAFSNGRYTGRGISCSGTAPSGFRFQCCELVMRHFLNTWGFRWYGNAKDLLRNAPRDTVDVFLNGDWRNPPAPGDMLVWTRGAFGHVALVTAVTLNGVDVIEQNWGTGRASFSYDGRTVGPRPDAPLWVPAGWIHAKRNVQVPAWDCARSRWGQSQLWTCDPTGARQRLKCVGAVPTIDRCPTRCVAHPPGNEDVCM